MAARHALEVAGITAATSPPSTCTPASPRRCSTSARGSHVAPDDPRGLTLTGGLPFFGGAGNNYSMHAIAETVQRARSNPGSFGFVGANGGIMSKYSAGVYSTDPGPLDRPTTALRLQAEIDGWPAPEEARHADGWATIETYTVKHARDGRRTGIVIGRLEADGRRFVASGDDDEPARAAHHRGAHRAARVYVESFGTETG